MLTRNGSLTKKFFWILYLISFIVVFLCSIYSNYTIKNDIKYYTVNYETFHLYDDCITISHSPDIRELYYEDIDEEKICKVCKWHYETSQHLTKRERKPN